MTDAPVSSSASPKRTSEVTKEDWEYPLGVPNKTGMLKVDDNPPHTISWKQYGNPEGEPVFVIHGGPGGTCEPDLSRFFDPTKYRIILFDQRGCGDSRPSVAENGKIALEKNTTDDLVEDIVKLRKELGIEGKMHVFGGSWGSTLAMVYAIRHPDTVQDLILRGISLGTPSAFQYMYQGNAATYHLDAINGPPGSYQTYPEAWKEFVEVVPVEDRGDMMKAYKKIFDMTEPMTEEQRALQEKAVLAWSVWEGTISHIIPPTKEDLAKSKFAKLKFALSFSQIEAHYFAHDLFLPPNYIADNVSKLTGIPIHIVHGRFDQVCPLSEAQLLVDALKKAGIEPASYIKTPAGHSALELENYKALVEIMKTLPDMPGFSPRAPASPAAATTVPDTGPPGTQ